MPAPVLETRSTDPWPPRPDPPATAARDAASPECDGCGPVTGELHATVAGRSRCAECLTDWQCCGDCDRFTAEPAGTDREDNALCRDCANARYDRCDDCRVLESDTHSRILDTTATVCRDCAENYTECADCQVLLTSDFGTLCESCDDEHDDDGFGDEDGDPLVHEYYYKPVPRFHGEGPVYLGMELEVATESRDRDDCARLALEHLGGLGYLKHDASIECGFEIVCHPMDYRWALERFPWPMLAALDDAGGFTDEGLGLHVHVSRTGFTSPAHVYRWMKLLYRNQSHAVALARRTSAQWASFDPRARADGVGIATGKPTAYHNRFQAINTRPDDTFEVRIFASSLDPQQVQAALGFVAATVDYTRGLTSADVARHRGWEWGAFVAWLRTRPVYTPLLTELEELRELACAS